MQIHTFRAESLQAALQLVRRQLGPDAAILHTREKRQGPLGIFAKPLIEVDATLGPANADTIDRSSLSVPSDPSQLQQNKSVAPEYLASSERLALPEQSSAIVSDASPSRPVSQQPATQQPATQPPATQPPVTQPPVTQQPVGRLKVSGALELSPDKPNVIALVGPTGCGKTTSLAKLAANFRFEMGCQVGLIALDSFRPGAVDQLLQYADMLSAPLEVVSSAEEVPAALQRLRRCDLVLVDTAGRAPRNAVHLDELRRFLELARPQSTQLVVSASSSAAHVSQTIECFAVLKPTDLLITKLDEAVDFESWSALLERAPLPISYLTHGQRVPQDISLATTDRMASLLLGQQLDSQQNFWQQAPQSAGLSREPGALQLSN